MRPLRRCETRWRQVGPARLRALRCRRQGHAANRTFLGCRAALLSPIVQTPRNVPRWQRANSRQCAPLAACARLTSRLLLLPPALGGRKADLPNVLAPSQCADSVQRLHAAIDAAEATGVEKPLVKKAKAALQALKKRKQHPGPAGSAPVRPAAVQQQQQQPLRQGSGVPTPQQAAVLSSLPSAASGSGALPTDASVSSGSSLSRAPSDHAGIVAVSASGSWVEAGGDDSLQQDEADGPASGSSAAPVPADQPPQPAARTPPKPVHLASYPSGGHRLLICVLGCRAGGQPIAQSRPLMLLCNRPGPVHSLLAVCKRCQLGRPCTAYQ